MPPRDGEKKFGPVRVGPECSWQERAERNCPCLNEAWRAPRIPPPMWQGGDTWLPMQSGGGGCPNTGIRIGAPPAAGAGSRSEW